MDSLLIALCATSASLFIIVITLSVSLFKNKRKLEALTAMYANIKSLIDDKTANINNNDVHQENFIKFLSDSREWAFEYIEEVQDGLATFIDAVDKDIEHFDQYGIVASSSPHYEPLMRISKEYKVLKNLLPEDKEE